MNARLYIWQRVTAMVMVPLVIIHLATMIYAIQDGLSATEILDRTRGSFVWGTFYGLFVLAASVHAAIGLRTVLIEWAGLRSTASSRVAMAISIALAVLGLRAVYGVVL